MFGIGEKKPHPTASDGPDKPEEVEPAAEPEQGQESSIKVVEAEKIIEDDQDAEIMKSFKEEPKEAVVEETNKEELKIKSLSTVDFYEALDLIAQGKKVHKLEWKNLGFYGVMDGDLLYLHKPDGKLYQWTLSKADIDGTDYVVIE